MRNQKGINNNNYKHGLHGSSLYNRWKHIKQRCCNPNDKAYKNYGGRGIKVCDEWLESFENFYNWAMQNGYQENLTIDRIDNNGNYEPNNCRWVDRKTQANNTRHNHLITYKGKTHNLSEWSRILGISVTTLSARINTRKNTLNKAMTVKRDVRRKVNQFDLKGNFIKQYDSVSSAMGVEKTSSITNCCKRKQKTAYGFIWRYADENNS